MSPRVRGAEPTVAAPPLPPLQEQDARPEGAGGDRGRDTRSPPPALVSPSPGGPPRAPCLAAAPLPRCPSPAPPDVPGASSGPPPARVASVGPVLRPAGVERTGSRGLRLPVPPRSPPRPLGPSTQLPGLGGCDNGL